MGSEGGIEQKPIVDQSLKEILSSAMAGLAQENKKAYEVLIVQAGEGFFEQHQAQGSLNTLADQLLRLIGEGERANAD